MKNSTKNLEIEEQSGISYETYLTRRVEFLKEFGQNHCEPKLIFFIEKQAMVELQTEISKNLLTSILLLN